MLEGLLKKATGTLCGGERRFLCNLVILSLDRAWYLLDEPFVEQDEENPQIMADIFKNGIRAGKRSFSPHMSICACFRPWTARIWL